MENAHLHHKNIHTCAFILENVLAGGDRLCRTRVLTGRRIQASRIGRTKHLGSVNGSSRLWQMKVFVSLSAAEADQKRPTRHRLCIISQVRFIGLTFFRNAAFEERTLRQFEHK